MGEAGGADRAGRGAEDGGPQRGWRSPAEPGGELTVQRIEQGRAGVHQAAADHDRTGVGGERLGRQGQRECLDGVVPHGGGVRIDGAPGGDLGGVTPDAAPGGVPAGDACGRRVDLQAAALPAGARFAVGMHRGVADLAGAAGGSTADRGADDVGSGDAGSQRDEQQVGVVQAGALGQRRSRDVAAEDHRHAQRIGEPVADRFVAPRQVRGVVHGPRVEHAGGHHAGGGGLGRAQRPRHLDHGGRQQRCGVRRLQRVGRLHAPVGGHPCALDGGAADVDADEVHAISP